MQLVVDAASEKYLEYSIEERKTRIQAGVNFIDEQLPELRTRSSQLQSQRQQLQQQYQLIDPNTRGQEVFTQFHELTNQQLSLQSQLRELKTQQALLQSKLNLTPDEALLASTLSQEPNRAALLSQLREVESQISLLSARFTPEYHVLQELKEQRNNLQALLEQKTQQVLDKESVSVATDSPILGFQDGIRLKLIQQLVDTANQIEVMEIRSQSLAANIKTSQQQAKRFPEVVRQHNNIERQLVLNNQILDQLLLQRETLRVEAAQDNLPWELISSPQLMLDAQGKPEALAPDRKKKLAAGALGGLLLGMATAVF